VLTEVAEGVLIHESAFFRSNAVVVAGADDGVLLIDAGVQDFEMACIAHDLAASGRTVVAGFSTHPHWDHLNWHDELGPAPRYATARAAAFAAERLSDPGAKARIAAAMIPPEIVDRVPLDLLGLITGLPDGATHIPWDGPRVRIIEHRAHAPGHAGLLIEERGVLVAGDMLSDLLIPMLDLSGGPADPVGDYLDALRLFEDLAGDAGAVIPGHGSVGRSDQVRARIDQDRAYVQALREDRAPADPRTGWPAGLHEMQLQRLGVKNGAGTGGRPG
jgi:glyoxylase-like metal-dependent hydrolase (beta-lactamase superfamily II)